MGDKKLHGTAKVVHGYPRERLGAGTDGGSYLRGLQRTKHLLHRSPIRRKHYAKACNDEPGRLGTVFGFFLPCITEIGKKTVAAGTGIFVRFHFRRIIAHGGN